MSTPLWTTADPLIALLAETPLVRERGGESLQRQLHQQIRAAILSGRMPSGAR